MRSGEFEANCGVGCVLVVAVLSASASVRVSDDICTICSDWERDVGSVLLVVDKHFNGVDSSRRF